MDITEVRRAVWQARQTMSAVDDQAATMADLLIGRLRKVSPYTLAKLKKELSLFNAHTKEWKEDK